MTFPEKITSIALAEDYGEKKTAAEKLTDNQKVMATMMLAEILKRHPEMQTEIADMKF